MSQYIQVEGGTQTDRHWLGTGPVQCDLCSKEEPPCFVDGAVLPSPATQFFSGWAIMCIPCFKDHGRGLGTGIGQKYCKKQ